MRLKHLFIRFWVSFSVIVVAISLVACQIHPVYPYGYYLCYYRNMTTRQWFHGKSFYKEEAMKHARITCRSNSAHPNSCLNHLCYRRYGNV